MLRCYDAAVKLGTKEMAWRITRSSLLALVWLWLSDPAYAFIERLTPLADLLEDSDYIFVAQVEAIHAEQKLATFRACEDLKGKTRFRTLQVHLTGDKEKHIPHLLKRIAPGISVVFFLTPVDKQWLGLGYTNGTWFQVIGRPASETVQWHFTHCEIYLRRTFKGTTDELITVIREVLAGKRKPPPPNPKEPPGFGPELPQDKRNSSLARGGKPLFAVILLPPLAGLLAPLLSLLFPGVLLAVWRQYRVLVYVLLLQSTILLVQAGLRWWEPSGWWLAARYWWWPTLTVYGLGLVIAGLHRAETNSSFHKPVALEWATLLTVLVLGLLWAIAAWYWYETIWDQMTPITLGSAVGVLHLVLRRLAGNDLFAARWKTGNVILTSMLLAGVWVAQQEWRSERWTPPSVSISTQVEEDWPTYRGNVHRTGCIDGSRIPQRPKILWTCDVRQGRGRFYVHSTPTLANGLAYVGVLHTIQGQTRGYLYCVAVEEKQADGQALAPGTVLWRFDADGTLKPVYCSPTVKRGRLYFGEGYHQDQQCRLFCLDAHKGQLLWHYQTRSHVECAPTLSGGFVVVGAGDDGLLALQESTANESDKVTWQIRDWHVDSSALVVNDVVYAGSLVGDLPTTNMPFVAAFRQQDGRTLWRIESPLPVAASLTYGNGKIFVPLANGKVNADDVVPLGGILCLEAESGRRLWLFEKCGPVFGTPVFSEGRVFFGSKDGRVRCLDADNGQLLWTQVLDDAIIASLALAETSLVAVSVSGTVYALDSNTGAVRWCLQETKEVAGNEPVYSSPVIYRGRIYVGMGSQLVCIGDE